MPTADQPILLSGGAVFTADPRRLWCDAVVVRDGIVAATGSRADLTSRFPNAMEVDIDGRTVLPGFIDAHNHFLATGESLAAINARFPSCTGIEQLVVDLTAAAASTPHGQWISAFGFDDAKYPRPLTRWDLDAASVTHPIRVYHVSGHHVVVNSTALAMRGVDERTPDPQGGRLERDTAGRLTGLCLDAAMNLILPVAVDIGSHGPNFHTVTTLEESVAAVDRASRAFVAAGLTTVCDAQVTARELVAYQEARRRGVLGVRTVCMPLSHQAEALFDFGMQSGFGDDHLRLGAMKFYADGSLIGGTACFHDAYGENDDLEGSMYWEFEQLADMIGRAHVAGWQIGVHVQGDKAIDLVLDAIEAAVALAPRDHRHRLEHAGYPTLGQITRIARLGVITVNQPSYLRDSGDDFLVRLGDRAHHLQPLRDELDAGVAVVLSSDSDVASYRPLDTIASAIERRTLSGASIGEDQALTLDEALRAHTCTAAYALAMEDRLGSLVPGALADVVILDGDLRASTPQEIRGMGTWLTVIEGRVVHAAADAPSWE